MWGFCSEGIFFYACWIHSKNTPHLCPYTSWLLNVCTTNPCRKLEMAIWNHQIDCPGFCVGFCDLQVMKRVKLNIFHDTEYPNWDLLSFNSTQRILWNNGTSWCCRWPTCTETRTKSRTRRPTKPARMMRRTFTDKLQYIGDFLTAINKTTKDKDLYW